MTALATSMATVCGRNPCIARLCGGERSRATVRWCRRRANRVVRGVSLAVHATEKEKSCMKALRWYGHGDVRVESVPDPEILEPTDVIVKITSTAICGSDLHIYDHYVVTMEKGDI